MSNEFHDLAVRIVNALKQGVGHGESKDRDSIRSRYEELRIAHKDGFTGAVDQSRVEWTEKAIYDDVVRRLGMETCVAREIIDDFIKLDALATKMDAMNPDAPGAFMGTLPDRLNNAFQRLLEDVEDACDPR